MAQKPCDHQLRLVVHPIFFTRFCTSKRFEEIVQWCWTGPPWPHPEAPVSWPPPLPLGARKVGGFNPSEKNAHQKIRNLPQGWKLKKIFETTIWIFVCNGFSLVGPYQLYINGVTFPHPMAEKNGIFWVPPRRICFARKIPQHIYTLED